MKHLTKLFILALLLTTMGVSCTQGWYFGGGKEQSREGVVLNQGEKPEDCGQRNPRKMLPYFEITNPRIVLGQSLSIDASCSVGRIAQLSWDFEFEAWPEATPPEQRFETPIRVEHWDLQNPDYAGQEYELNNFGPFYQTYTPTQAGTLTMRLKTKDQAGREQTVIHTYVVSPRSAPQTSGLRANFYIVNELANAIFPQGTLDTPVYLAPLLTSQYSVQSVGRNSSVTIYDWRLVTRSEGGENVLDTVTDNLVSRAGADGVLPTTPYGMTLSQAFNQPRQDFRVSLDVKDQQGVGNAFAQYFRIADSNGISDIIPQLTVLPVDSSVHIDSGVSALSGISLPRSPEQIVIGQGQSLFMQNVSMLPIPFNQVQSGPYADRVGPIIIEFDKGDGGFEVALKTDKLVLTPYTIAPGSAPTTMTYQDFYKYIFVAKKYDLAVDPGNYVARMRITMMKNSAPTEVEYQKVVVVPYTVTGARAVPFFPRLSASASMVYADEQVTFDASASTGNLPHYDWVIRDTNNGSIVFSQRREADGKTYVSENGGPSRETNQTNSATLVYRFRTPGNYRVTMTTYRDPDGRTEQAEVDVKVNERKQEYVGHLSEIRLEIYPAGVARGGNLVDQASYANDRIVFGIPNLDATAGKVEWDFDSDGTMDKTCDVEIVEGYVTCNTLYKDPPHAVTGEVTATVWVSERGGQGRLMQQKTYQVLAQDRIMRDQLGRPLQ